MFGYGIDKKTLYIVAGILVIISLFSYGTDGIIDLLLSVPAVLIAITVHEFGHAFAAYKLGDDTPVRQGRLSLNPFDHIDPLGIAMLLFAHIGWGKPVEVNPRNYTRKISMEKGEAIVSAAGPLMNIILAFIFTLIYCAIYKFAGAGFLHSTMGSVLMLMIFYTISINVGLGVFNLIPLPPLDGSKIIMPFLPYKAKEWFINNEQIFYLVFVVLWITGLAGTIISPAISWITNGFLSIGKIIF